MIRLKFPPLPTLDDQDRRIISICLVVALAFLFAVVTIAAGLGLGVRVFNLLAWGG